MFTTVLSISHTYILIFTTISYSSKKDPLIWFVFLTLRNGFKKWGSKFRRIRVSSGDAMRKYVMKDRITNGSEDEKTA